MTATTTTPAPGRPEESAPGARNVPAKRRGRDPERLFNRITLGVVIGLALVWLVPLLWALATSLRPAQEVVTDPTSWFTTDPTLKAYGDILGAGKLPYWYANSFITSALTTVLTVAVASLAGFALSHTEWRGRRLAFVTLLAGIMIPGQVLMIPQFLTLQEAGLLNTYWGVVLPQVPNAVAVFVFKQFFDGIPRELIDAARADGAGWLRIYARIVMPVSRPVISAVTIFVFVGVWNNFLWPLLVVTDPEMMTLPVGLTSVQDVFGVPYAQLMASCVLGAIPLLAVFAFFQRHIVEGIAGTGLK